MNGPAILERRGSSLDVVDNLGEAYTQHGLLDAIARQEPAIDVLGSILLPISHLFFPPTEARPRLGTYRMVAHYQHGVYLLEI